MFFFLVSCVYFPQALREKRLLKDYLDAIEDARVAETDEISENLIAIVESNNNLIWKGKLGNRRVLVVTWTLREDYQGNPGRLMVASEDIWVTVVPEVKNFCRKNRLSGRALSLRIEQLLGLPPHGGKKNFVEIWVDPNDLFRPAPDPEITDSESGLHFHEGVSERHVEWINNLRSDIYKEGGYPWTRLGYTYDWGNPKNGIGLSEFVIREGAIIEIFSVSDIGEY